MRLKFSGLLCGCLWLDKESPALCAGCHIRTHCAAHDLMSATTDLSREVVHPTATRAQSTFLCAATKITDIYIGSLEN